MEENQDAGVDDVDRESLVKEIELIRQTLGSASTRAHSDGGFGSYNINTETEKDSDDSEDELAIIKSPEYRQTSDETYAAQYIPVEIISSESEDEIEIIATKHAPPTIVSGDSDFSSDGNVAYQISSIVALNSESESEHFVKHVSRKQDEDSTSRQASPKQFDSLLDKTNDSRDDYTLTELQPAENSTQIPQEGSYQSSLGTVDQNSHIGLAVPTVDHVIPDDDEEVLLSDVEEDGELTEQQRCLKLNRKYQAIIEAQLRKVEKLIIENREKQFRLSEMSSSSLNADEIERKNLASYSPYFRNTRKECLDDNEDTKIRKILGQPHPFQKPPKPWSKDEKKILSDAVKSEILQAKLTPLLQRIETMSQKGGRTNEDENELEELRRKIDYIKTLPLSLLIENFNETIDFEDICNKMLPSRTAHQCKLFWYNELHPLLNKGKWTKDEDKLLLKLAEESTGGDWDKIACELKSNRSAAQCLQRYQKSLNTNFLKSKWEPEDDEKLKEAVRICGIGPWQKVSSFLDGRTGPQCMHRYKSVDPQIKRGKWEQEEDDLVRKGVELYGTNWIKFRNLLPRRTGAQVRERWQDVLNPELRKDAWTEEEDEILLKMMEEQNVGLKNWSTIAKYLPGRTDNKCRRRWYVLMKNDPKTIEHLNKQKITRAKLVNNFSRRRADKPNIGPEDFELSDLSETDENSSNTPLPDASVEDSTEADAVVSEDTTAAGSSENGTTAKASASSKDGTPAKDSVSSKDGSAVKVVVSEDGTAIKVVVSEDSTVAKDVVSEDGIATKAVVPEDGTAAKFVASKRRTSSKSVTSKDRTSGKSVACKGGTPGTSVASKGGTPGTSVPSKGGTLGTFVASKGGTLGKSVASKGGTLGKSVASKGGTLGKSVASKGGTSGKSVATKGRTSTKALVSEDTAAPENNAAPAPAPATKATETDKGAKPKASMRKAGKKQREKNTKTDEVQTGKQAASSKSPNTSSDVLSSDKQKRKKVCAKGKKKPEKSKDPVEPTPTIPSSQQPTKVAPKSSEKAPTDRLKKTQKPKLTAPSPTVVSQASSLPNAMPISLLTQFSVLLQAFHVDVSGVLKNVSTQGPVTTPQPNSGNVSETSSIPGQTPVTTVAQTQSQTPATGNSGVASHENTSVINTSSSTVTHATACTKQVGKSNNESEKQSVSVEMSNRSNSEITNSTTVKVTDTPKSYTSSYPEGRITEKTMAENTGFTPRIQQVAIDDSVDYSHNASGMNPASHIEKSSINTDTSSSSETTVKDNDTSQERYAGGYLRRKRKRDYAGDIDVVAEKRFNDDGGKETGKGPIENTDVVLSDSRHGLNHDIVLANSTSYVGEHGVGTDANKTQTKTSKRKRNGNRSNQSRSKRNTNGNTSSIDIEYTETSPGRYPKRSKFGRSNVNDSTRDASTENTKTADTVTERLPASNVNEGDDSESPSSPLNPTIGNNRFLHVKRIIMNNDVRLPQVPAIPALPPSATTLGAFKKLLSLRKDLQSQTSKFTHYAARQATDQPEIQNELSSNQSTLKTTSLQKPCADGLLLVSNTKQTSYEEFRNSVAYQQLLNRFKGLFMWPGFLSIVNPSLGKSNEDPKKTTQTPEVEKRKRRRRTR